MTVRFLSSLGFVTAAPAMLDPSPAGPNDIGAQDVGSVPYLSDPAPGHSPGIAARPMFEILIREHAPMLQTYLRAIVHEAGLREELFADTVVVAWRSLARFDESQPFSAWLRGIARRLLLAHGSKKRMLELSPEILDVLEDRFARIGKRPGDTFDDQIAFLQDCLRELAPRSLEVVEGTYFESVPAPQLGMRLGLSADNTRKILTRARLALRDCVRRRLSVLDLGDGAGSGA